MPGKIISLCVMAIGAFVCYLARLLTVKVLKKDPDDKTIAQVKLVGFGIVLVGIALLFIIGGVKI